MTLPSPELPFQSLATGPGVRPAPRLDRLSSGSARGGDAASGADAADRRIAGSGLHEGSGRCQPAGCGLHQTSPHCGAQLWTSRGADRSRRGSGRHLYRLFWQTLAARPSAAAPDSAAAAVIEMIFRQGLLQQPILIDDLADGASWNGLGRRALLVVRIEGSSRQPVRLVWYASRPATLSPYADVAEAFAHHASLAFRVITERDNANRAVAARHRVGLAQGILMTRHQLKADQAFTLLKCHSQNTHVTLRMIAQTVILTGDLPVCCGD